MRSISAYFKETLGRALKVFRRLERRATTTEKVEDKEKQPNVRAFAAIRCGRTLKMAHSENEVIVIPDDDNDEDDNNPDSENDAKVACREQVMAVFPDICPDHLEILALNHGYDPHALIPYILDQVDNGKPFPKRQRISLKRKREDEEEDVADRLGKAFSDPDRRGEQKHHAYVKQSYVAPFSLLSNIIFNIFALLAIVLTN